MLYYIPVSRRRWWLWVSFSTSSQHSCRPSNLLFWCHLEFTVEHCAIRKEWEWKWWSQGAFQQIYPPQNYHIHVCISIYIYIRTSHFWRSILYQSLPSSQPSVKPCTWSPVHQTQGCGNVPKRWSKRMMERLICKTNCWKAKVPWCWWVRMVGRGWWVKVVPLSLEGGRGWGLRIRGHGEQHNSLFSWSAFFSKKFAGWRICCDGNHRHHTNSTSFHKLW